MFLISKIQKKKIVFSLYSQKQVSEGKQKKKKTKNKKTVTKHYLNFYYLAHQTLYLVR